MGDNARYKAPIELELMAAVKKALDPANLLNPQRVFPLDRRQG